MLKPKLCCLRTSDLVNSWSIRYQLPWPTIKAYMKLSARGRGHTVSRRTRAATQIVIVDLYIAVAESLMHNLF